MVYNNDITGKFVVLRSITVDDAEFSFSIRNDPRFVDVMGQPAASIEAQRKYIVNQRNKPGDYYFVVYNKQNIKIGLIGVYNIIDDTCETGREINIGEPYETMEAEVLLFDFCVNTLGLKHYHSIIYKNNPRQLKMILRDNVCDVSEVLHNGIPSYLLSGSFQNEKKKIERMSKMIDSIYSRRK